MFRTALISLAVAAVVVPVAASAAQQPAAVYQHSPGLRDSVASTAPVGFTSENSPSQNRRSALNAVSPATADALRQNRIAALDQAARVSEAVAADPSAGLTASQPEATPVRFTSENGSTQNRVSFLNGEEQAAQQRSGFDWNDAGIGALSGIGVLLIAGALFATIRRTPNHRIAL